MDAWPLFWVRIADDALDGLILAALEAYCLGDGRDLSNSGPSGVAVETGGLLWGSVSGVQPTADDRILIQVQKTIPSISATRTSGSFSTHNEAPALMNNVIARRAPELILLGEFHTHPYSTLENVTRIRGHEFSVQDISAFLHGKTDQYYWQCSKYPLMLAVTICKLRRVREKIEGEQTDWNCYSFDVGEFRFWVRAMVGYLYDDDPGLGKQHTAISCSVREGFPQVFLDMNTKFYNSGGDRIYALKRIAE